MYFSGGSCLTCPSNKVPNEAGNDCVCDSSNGWKPINRAIAGAQIINGCCNTSIYNYHNSANPAEQFCCPVGRDGFLYRDRQGYNFYPPGSANIYSHGGRTCCPANRPHRIDDYVTNADMINEDMAHRLNCRVCANSTDTVVGGICKSCAEAYPGENRLGVYDIADGYAKCMCPENTIEKGGHCQTCVEAYPGENRVFDSNQGVCICPEGSIDVNGHCLTCDQIKPGSTYQNGECVCVGKVEDNGECKTCEDAYDVGYTYTPYGSGSHCCAPGYEQDSSEVSGCSKCPAGIKFNSTCNQCEKDCSFRGGYFSTSKCDCACASVGEDNSNLEPDMERGCCYCSAKDTTKGGEADPLFSADGLLHRRILKIIWKNRYQKTKPPVSERNRRFCYYFVFKYLSDICGKFLFCGNRLLPQRKLCLYYLPTARKVPLDSNRF